MADLSKLIDLSLLRTFGELTIVPTNRAITTLAAALEAMADSEIASATGAHGFRYYQNALQYATYTYNAVTPSGNENPSEQGWYVQIPGGYKLSEDTEVKAGTTYFTKTTNWNTISTESVESALAGIETSPATKAHDQGSYIMYGHEFYRVTAAIAIGDSLVSGTNIEKTTVGEELQNGGGGTTIVQLPTVTVGSYTYDGTAKGPTITGLDTAHCTVTDATKTDAGTYTLTIALNNSNTMVWNDLTNQPKTYEYTINKATVTVPTVSATSKTYNGSAQHPTVAGYDDTKMTRTGYEYTDAGDYTLSFDLIDSDNYQWSGSTTSFAWSIAKANGSVTLSKNSITLSGNTTSDTVTISNGTGDITISSSDTTVATVSPSSMSASGGTLTVTSPNKKSGTATITVSVAGDANHNATSKTISFTGNYTVIYGVQWDGTSTTAMSRTDGAASFTDPVPAVNNGNGSSPFDTISPWKDMVKETRNGNVMVKIPKFYFKWTKTGTTMKLQICMSQESGFQVAPAFMDRGDGKGERDYVYVARYHCGASDYKSKTGVKPEANHTRAEFRSSIHSLGSNIWQWDYAMLETIWMLYLVEYADWNSQAKIGYGCGNNSSTENMGSTDGMTYHTGTNAANRTTYGHVQYRYIEDLWGNVYDWCDGIYFSGADVYAIKNPSDFSDTANGTKVGTRPTSGNYIKAWAFSSVSGFGWFLYPSEVGGSDSTYTPDYCVYDASGVVLFVGGSYVQNQSRGLFCLYGNCAASSKSAGIGSRLQELP